MYIWLEPLTMLLPFGRTGSIFQCNLHWSHGDRRIHRGTVESGAGLLEKTGQLHFTEPGFRYGKRYRLIWFRCLFCGAGYRKSFIDSAGGSLVNTRTAIYWKNGILNNLEPNSRGSAAEGISFDGSDMYVVGHVFSDSDTAVQWKNGVRTNYTSDNGKPRSLMRLLFQVRMYMRPAFTIIRRYIGKMAS